MITSTIIDKLGDNLQKVRLAAEECLISISDHPCFGVGICLRNIMRDGPAPGAAKGGAKKAMQSSKNLVGKYYALQKMLKNHQFSPD